MLKRNITYEDFNGDTVTETFYFNLSKTEIVELELSHEGGLEKSIERIIEAKDMNALLLEFKSLVLASYGERSQDGKRFVKNNELRTQFEQTAAYDALFMELATNEDAAVAFIQGIVPKDVGQNMTTKTVSPTPLLDSVTTPPEPVADQPDPSNDIG